MQDRRRRRGFEHAGALPPDRLGLPRARAQELVLAKAWKAVAGANLVKHARALRVQRGVLEVEVSGGRWKAMLQDLLPGLAGRLARNHPALAVRKVRWFDRSANERGPIQPIEICRATAGSDLAARAPRAAKHEIEIEDRRDPEQRLEELARRYVERRSDQNQ